MDTEPTTSTSATRTGKRFGVGTLILVALLSAGVAAGAALLLPVAQQPKAAPPVAADSGAPAPVLYQCPMHPSIVQDHPGDCPICGMKLVKVDKLQAGSADQPADDGSSVAALATVKIDPARQQLISLETEEVTEGTISGAWRTVGRVAIDETRVRRINIKVSGFVERIYVDFVGKRVKKGDPLFSVYSPDLLSAQEELLLALKTKSALAKSGTTVTGDGDALVAAARRKLALWDIPEAEIDRLARTSEPTRTLTFHSPVSGVVTRKDAVQGMKLDAGAMPYELVDLSVIWVLADVYEGELRLVKEGLEARLTLNAFPNREFQGKVAFIDPLLDPQTRTVKVRLAFANPHGELKPGMYGEVVLLGEPHDGLRIPSDAIIDSGTQKVVFVALGDGKFQPHKVELGDSDGAHVEVLSGLARGQRVVTRANFLIDSESRLRASLAQTSADTAAPESVRALPETPTRRHEGSAQDMQDHEGH